ncbi:addiction module protein [Belliella sp. DSM 107340]|uniref:Addiction module protein n=1 Tax=Belliella calami TaxID=2923436 RepID=A0ABS9UQ13_9BACT|nr:addiction module protein [Belliella calami]MCH7398348.1 addiction module protein [Belliella calami]
MENNKKIIEHLMKLSPIEKANVIDLLLKSLDEPDPVMDQLWAKEVESRIDAFDRGKLQVLTQEEFFKIRRN